MPPWMDKRPRALIYCQWKDQAPEEKRDPFQTSSASAPQQLDLSSLDTVQSQPNKCKGGTERIAQRSMSSQPRARSDGAHPHAPKKRRHRVDPPELAGRGVVEYAGPPIHPEGKGGHRLACSGITVIARGPADATTCTSCRELRRW